MNYDERMKSLRRMAVPCLLVSGLIACTSSPTATLSPTLSPTFTVPPTSSLPATSTQPPVISNTSVILSRGDAARTGIFNFPAINHQPQVKWQTKISDLFLGTPLVAERILYTGGTDGSLYALNTETGDILWSEGDFEVIESATAIHGDVIIGAGQNQKVRALDRHTGETLWSFDASTFVFAAPLIIEDKLYVASYQKLYALDLETGGLVWQSNTGSQMAFASAPAFAGDTIFVSVDRTLFAFDSATGAERWRVESKTAFWSLAIGNGLVYAGNGDGYMYAYAQETGQEQWRFKAKFGNDDIWSAPAVTNRVVYVGSRDQYMYAIDALTGEQRWAFKTNGDSVGDPVISDGLLYFSDSNHFLPLGARHLLTLDAETGQEVWTYELQSTLLTTPALSDGTIFITITGAVIALE